MLAKIGAKSIDELFRDVPASARLGARSAACPDHQGELEVERAFQAYAAKNVSARHGSVLHRAGRLSPSRAGDRRLHDPARRVLTSYTPYQPESPQGTLAVSLEFQTQVTLLTGMEVANASMLRRLDGSGGGRADGHRVTRRHKALISGGLHPHLSRRPSRPPRAGKVLAPGSGRPTSRASKT